MLVLSDFYGTDMYSNVSRENQIISRIQRVSVTTMEWNT